MRAGGPLSAYQRQVLSGSMRLPLVQDPGGNAARNFQASLVDRDALRRAPTSQAGVVKGYLPAVQLFRGPPSQQGTNSEAAMIEGLSVANSRRIVNKSRGQGFGL